MKIPFITLIATAMCVYAIQPDVKPDPQPDRPVTPTSSAGYVLGVGDQVIVRVMNVEQIDDKPIVIDLAGTISLPRVGRIQAAGLTTEQLETSLAEHFREFLLNPDVSVRVAEFHGQPVSVIGAVKTPGIQQVQGRRTLVEMLSLAGGVDVNAGSTVKITRHLEQGRIPLPGAADDPTGQFSVAEVSLKTLFDGKTPESNILIEPNDVISVPRADSVYVIGSVQKPGSFLLNEHKASTVLQALSMAGGLETMAKPKDAKILRQEPGVTARKEIPVNVKDILIAKAPDVPLLPEDILFIPANGPKKAAARAAEAAIQMGTGVVIWGR